MRFLFSLLPFIILFIYDFIKSLHMAQQNLYNDDNRFFKWVVKNFKQFKTPLKCSVVVLITYLLIVILKLNSKIITAIYFFLVCLIILRLKVKENKKMIQRLV